MALAVLDKPSRCRRVCTLPLHRRLKTGVLARRETSDGRRMAPPVGC
jgi:hypothetical protein